MQVKDLQPRQGKVDIVLDIVDVGGPREFEKFGRAGRVTTAVAKDETGDIKLTLWNDDIEKVKAGDKFRFGRSRYKVYDVRIVQAEEVWVLDGIPDDEIRIQTCYSDDPNEYPAKRRVIVFAKKI